MNRRKRGKKSGTGERGWEKKIQRQGGKCRGEEREWRRNKIDRSRFLEAKRKYRLKEVIEKATTEKEMTVRESKRAGRKNRWWDREYITSLFKSVV
jgi:hypothetical protein